MSLRKNFKWPEIEGSVPSPAAKPNTGGAEWNKM
jgi:hypothetical protein